ncbi:MAG TPA: PilW family protein [Noviherbaspirillum sp.]|nr:PilW family protein [Noviherbaspirillum sp.]
MHGCAKFCVRQHGLTLVELTVSMALGLLVVAAATVVLVSAKAGYIAQSDTAQILDTGRHAIEIVSRIARQASYLDWAIAETDAALLEPEDPAIFGLDSKSLKSQSEALSSPMVRSINGSDVLAVRFAGSGDGSNGDGTVLNCAGFGVGRGDAKDPDGRGWSIFYVAEDATGEPELYCKYPGESGWASQAIARGVESFQVLYALDTDDDGYPNTLLNASAIDAMDSSPPGARSNVAASGGGKTSDSHWNNVVAVKVAVLVRGAQVVQDGARDKQYDLFGKSYSDAHAGRDKGVRVRVADIPKAARHRVRKVFSTTIWLRNRSTGA